MEEKKSIKVSLGTVVCIFIIIVLVIGIAIMYVQNDKRVKELETQKTILESQKDTLAEKLNTVQESNEKIINELNKQETLISTESKETNNTTTETNTTTKNSNTVTKDTVTSSKSYGEPLPNEGQAILKDGYLYYSRSENEELRKIDGASNIKSLYIYNIGTGINKVPFVVTNDGTVYRLNSEEKLVKYEALSKYKVSKIVSHEGEMTDTFTLLLLDGTTKIVEVK